MTISEASVLIYGMGKKPSEATSKTELLAAMDNNVALGRKAIAETSDDDLAEALPAADEIQGTAFCPIT